jgi:hypothetical protein
MIPYKDEISKWKLHSGLILERGQDLHQEWPNLLSVGAA